MTHAVTAELVATVLTIDVQVGDHIKPEDAVMVLESMKMEIPVLAEVRGTIVEISVKAGDVVHDGDPLLLIDEA